VPDKISASRRILDFIDRCHSLTSLYLPQAALGSLPVKIGNASTKPRLKGRGFFLPMTVHRTVISRQDDRLPCPVAVPDEICTSRWMLDFIDRCHSLTSFPLPQAALRLLPVIQGNANA